MKLCVQLFSVLALAFFIPGFAHRSGCRYGSRCGGVGYGESIDAGSEVSANGIFTRSGGRSTVETDSFGSRGRTDYYGEGVGRGHTSARGRGGVRSNSPYGSTGVNVGSSSSSFGTHSSGSKVDGHASLNNGFSSGAAGASAHGSGFGYSNARTQASANRCGIRCKRQAGFGTGIDAGAKADAFGTFTKTNSNSAVESGPFFTQGQVGHKASAHGFGASGAFSGGRIDVSTPYGGHSTLSKGAAQAHGGNSYAWTQGGANTLNHLSQSEASASSGASGFGASGSSSKATAGQLYRHKRCIGIRCGLDINGQTNAQANGHWTNTHGSSSVSNGVLGVHGNVNHGASGVGQGFTGAASQGSIRVGDCLGCRSGVYTAGRANGYGDVHSHSSTLGNVAYHNGYSHGAMHSSAGGSGFGASSSSSSASAGRFKRHSGMCLYPPCIKGIDAASRGGSTGLRTESVVDSSVFSEPGRLGGYSEHKAIGSGPGATGANSWSGIDVEDVFGHHGTIQAGGNARAFGQSSLSATKSGTKFLNGQSVSVAESTGRASGRGHSAARSEAVARRSKRSTSGEIFLNGRSEKVDEQPTTIADETGLSAFDLIDDDQYGLTSIATAQGFGNEQGKAGGHLNSRDNFGQYTIKTDEWTEAFGQGSVAESIGNIDKHKGQSFTSSGSSAHVEGNNGFSSAHSHTSSDNEGLFV